MPCAQTLEDFSFDLCLVVDGDADILLTRKARDAPDVRRGRDHYVPRQYAADHAHADPDVIFLDANFARGATGGAEGFDWLGRMLSVDPRAAIVLITTRGGVQIAVIAMKRGATDFVSKPWTNGRLLATVRSAAALRRSRLKTGVEGGSARRAAFDTSINMLIAGCTMLFRPLGRAGAPQPS